MKLLETIEKHYSTVIVGAGPAGSTLARRLSQSMSDILLIDASAFLGEKVCGGLISPDAQDLLAEYGIALPRDILSSPQIFSVRTLDLSCKKTRNYRRNYINVDRAGFDAFLLSLVPDSVNVISAVCISIKRINGGFSLILKTHQGEKELTCNTLIGADGASSTVRRNLFSKQKITRYVAIQQSFHAKNEHPYYSCIFDSDTSPSCSWIFFKDGRLVFGGAFESKNPRAAFESQKEKLVMRGIIPEDMFKEALDTRACTVLRPGLFSGIYLGKSGAFLIGEAAGFISPSSLEGISFALASAEALYRALESSKNTRATLRAYKRKSAKLRLKIALKCFKRPFMYMPLLRKMILSSGVGSIKTKEV